MSGILFRLAILAIVATAAVKFVPHYLQYGTVRSVMHDLQADPSVAGLGRKALKERIDKQLYINNLKSVTHEDFTFSRLEHADELSVDYEVREPLFGNLDAVLTFSHKIQIDRK